MIKKFLIVLNFTEDFLFLPLKDVRNKFSFDLVKSIGDDGDALSWLLGVEQLLVKPWERSAITRWSRLMQGAWLDIVG